jgi:surface antigen
MTKETQFVTELRANIRAYIREVKRCGTVRMSEANLRQCVKTPRATEGAPMGGSVQWQYAQLFRAVCNEPAFKSFLI